ncbi:hypothetical protein JOD46_003496 [Agromyces aurantiacus]|nr:hypothetical protein [Agromyces aurantiacus]
MYRSTWQRAARERGSTENPGASSTGAVHIRCDFPHADRARNRPSGLTNPSARRAASRTDPPMLPDTLL